MSKKKFARSGLTAIAVASTVGCLAVILYNVNKVSIDFGIEPLPFNDLTSKSIDLQVDLSRTLFQIALVMTGALLGLVIAKEDEVKIVFSKPHEAIMFFCASFLLLLSMSSYGYYISTISNYFADAVAASKNQLPISIPNIFNQNVNYLFDLQLVSLIAGIVSGVLTFVSAHKLRK